MPGLCVRRFSLSLLDTKMASLPFSWSQEQKRGFVPARKIIHVMSDFVWLSMANID